MIAAVVLGLMIAIFGYAGILRHLKQLLYPS
jgi:hypothetical protein